MKTIKEIEDAVQTSGHYTGPVPQTFSQALDLIAGHSQHAAIDVAVSFLEGGGQYAELKRVIREAARIRDESWDQPYAGHRKTIKQAVCEVTQDDETIRLASILLSVAWNDALEFAGRIEGEKSRSSLRYWECSVPPCWPCTCFGLFFLC